MTAVFYVSECCHSDFKARKNVKMQPCVTTAYMRYTTVVGLWGSGLPGGALRSLSASLV